MSLGEAEKHQEAHPSILLSCLYMSLVGPLCLGINTEAIWVFSILLVVAPFNLGQSIEAVPTIKNWCSVQPSSPSSAKGSFSNIKQPLSTYRVYVNLSLSAFVGNSTIFVKLGMDPLSIATAVVSR
jgi:hypothetical protein